MEAILERETANAEQYSKKSRAALEQEYRQVRRDYNRKKEEGLRLDMSRGKPCKKQLDMVSDMLCCPQCIGDCMMDGVDVRNYGMPAGLPSARRLFAELLGTRPEEVFVGGNASLSLMYGVISKAYTHGLLHSPQPWAKEPVVKFLCPAPGYDRHFKITESFGMELLTVPMTEEGPDMALVERLVQDPAVKGMWCVPKYSNPQGIIYSDTVIDRIARLRPAAPDFALMWDNAYCVHEFRGDFVPFRDILTLCRENGRPDMVYEFASTSKITFPGAGIACIAASEENLKHLTALIGIETIGYDKVNQLRHVRYLQDKAHTLALMKRHAALLAPKFLTVLSVLDQELSPLGIAQWTRPTGGYFISLDAMPGTAKRALALCREAGVTMTGAGAAFPYGIDPADSNIRIAPTLPPVDELEQAIRILCICLRLAALEKLLDT